MALQLRRDQSMSFKKILLASFAVLTLLVQPLVILNVSSVSAESALAAPINLLPSNNAFTNNPNFSMKWNAVTDAVGYQYRTSNTVTDGVLGAIIYCDGSVAVSDGCNGAGYNLVPGNFAVNSGVVTRGNSGTPEGVYYWQVRAIGEGAVPGPWSEISKVTYSSTQAPSVDLVSPVNGATIRGDSVTQSWTAGDSTVTRYIYESYNDAGATSLRFHGEYTTTSKTATNVADATYYWRVRAVNHLGSLGPWSALWKLTIDNTSPTGTVTVSGAGAQATATLETSEPVQTPSGWTQVTDKTFTRVHTENVSYSVSFTDFAGNTGSTNYDVTTIDTTAPVVSLSDITSVNEGEAVTVSGTVDDTSVSQGEVFIDGTPAIDGIIAISGGTFSFTITGLSEGNYDITVKAKDSFGNEGVSSAKVATINPAPIVIVPTVSGPVVDGDDGVTPDTPEGEVQPQIFTIPLLASQAILGDQSTNDDVAAQAVAGAETEGDNQDVKGLNDTKQAATSGFAWYWWLLIVAGLIGLWLAYAAWSRNRRSQNE